MASEWLSSGTRVFFRLSDILSPGLNRILDEVTPELAVAGEVMFLNDPKDEERGFVIVSVGETMSPVVVPTDRIRVLSQVGKSHDSIGWRRIREPL